MTDEELAGIKETWRVHASASWYSLYHESAMRWMVPALLAEVERLRTEIAAMREVVQVVATVEDATILDACPHCRAEQGYTTLKHTPDCPVTKARALLATEQDATQ